MNLANQPTLSNSKPRIIYLIPNDWYFWTHRLHLAQAARDAGYEVTIATLPGEYVERIKAEGFIFHPLKLQRLKATPWTELKTIADIVSLHRRVRPAIVHQVTLRVVLYGSIAAKITRIPTVNAITGLGYLFIANGLKERVLRNILALIFRFFLKGRNVTIFQNEDDRGAFLQRKIVRKNQTVLIAGAGVNTQEFAPSPEPEGILTILLTARMLKDKGIIELVEASRLLKQRGNIFRVVLAGMLDPGNPTAITEQEINEWQAEGLIEWIGQQSDIAQRLAQCHIVCLPSYREGLPLSLIEAAAAGRPIVATDVPGCREIVRDDWNGLLVPARDCVALAEALQKLMQDAQLRKQFGLNGRQLAVEKFTQETVIQQTMKVYQALIQGETI
jgi:glycosyltransferase involved in cell wall biosynthesis